MLPRIYPIVNFKNRKRGLKYFETLLSCEIDLIQLRAKDLSIDELSEIACQAAAIRNRKRPSTRIIINDYPEVCNVSQADGVHLGQQDSDAEDAREKIGPGKIIGLSTHNLQQVMQANQEKSLSYIALGPLFESPTKSGHAPSVGLENLRQAANLSRFPIVAIGGITSENSPGVFQAGAQSVAVISDLEHAAEKGLEALLKKIRSY